MNNIIFSSILKSKYRDELEKLLYFNPEQGKIRPGVTKSIERYGNPEIYVDGDLLRIRVEAFSDVQTVYVFHKGGRGSNLIGLLVYVRPDLENIIVLHIAVREEYSMNGCYSDEMLLMRLIIKLREIASRINGVDSLIVMYETGVVRKIRL